MARRFYTLDFTEYFKIMHSVASFFSREIFKYLNATFLKNNNLNLNLTSYENLI